MEQYSSGFYDSDCKVKQCHKPGYIVLVSLTRTYNYNAPELKRRNPHRNISPSHYSHDPTTVLSTLVA